MKVKLCNYRLDCFEIIEADVAVLGKTIREKFIELGWEDADCSIVVLKPEPVEK